MNVVIMVIQSFHCAMVSITSGHHYLQQLHELVQEKNTYTAKLNRKLVTLSREREDALYNNSR